MYEGNKRQHERTNRQRAKDLKKCEKFTAAFDAWLEARGEDGAAEVNAPRIRPGRSAAMQTPLTAAKSTQGADELSTSESRSDTSTDAPHTFNTPAYSMAANEIPVKEFVLQQKGIDAVQLELEAMTTNTPNGGMQQTSLIPLDRSV